MAFELRDVQTALDKIGMRPRNEGETAFPDSPTLVATVKTIRRDRKVREEQEQRDREWAAYCAQVAQERSEEEKAGVRVLTEQEQRLERILAAARHEKARTIRGEKVNFAPGAVMAGEFLEHK